MAPNSAVSHEFLKNTHLLLKNFQTGLNSECIYFRKGNFSTLRLAFASVNTKFDEMRQIL